MIESVLGKSVAANLSTGGTIDGDLTITGSLGVAGDASINLTSVVSNSTIIDATGTEALLVRKNSDGGDVLVVNTTNVRVGIGVADPDHTLEVFSTAAQLKLSYDADSFATFAVDASDDVTIKTAASGGFRFQATTDTTDYFQILDADGGTAIFNVDATNERIGIGVAAPSQLLHLKATDNKSIILIEDSETNTVVGDITGGIWFQNDDAYGTDPHIAATIEAVAYDVYGSSDLVFGTSFTAYPAKPTERMRIQSETGNIGIGVSAPSSLLEIQGGLTTTGAVLTLSTKEPSVVANDVLGRINFQSPLDTGADSDLVGASIAAIAQDTFSDTVNSTALHFQTGKSELATTKMVIDEDGSVGIGTASPAGTASAGILDIENITASSSTEGGNLRLGSNDGAVMASGHRLGVIEFAGAEDTSSTMTVGARIEAVTDAIWSASENGADMVFYTTDGNASQSEVMRLKSAKNVQFTSDVSLNSALTLGSGGSTNGKINTPESMYFNIDSDNSQTDTEFVWGCNRIADSSGTELMRLTEAGSLGIGVVPDDEWDTFTALQIGETGAIFAHADGTGAGSAIHITANTYYDSRYEYLIDASDEASRYTQENGTHQFFTAPAGTHSNAITFTERMRISSSGIGIGIAAPSTLLEVAQSAGDENATLSCYSTVNGHMATLNLRKSSNATIGTAAATAAGEVLGQIVAQGYDTDNDLKGSSIIRFEGDAAPDGDSVPGRILFMTSDLDDSGSPTERMRIDDSGVVTIVGDVQTGKQINQLGASGEDVEIRLVTDAGAANADYWKIMHKQSNDALLFQNYGTGAFVSYLALDASGNLGIGSDPPSSPNSITKFLHIKDSDNVSIVLEETSVNTYEIYVNAGNFRIADGTDIRLNLDANGNLGLGDDTPDEAKLSITGVLAGDYGLKIDNDQNTTALYIDADGVTSNHTFFIDAPTTTTGRVLSVNDCDSLTTGSVALLTSNSSDVSVRKLVHIINDNTAAVGAIPLYIQQDSTGPAISAEGGIVEQGGTLKENLLSNSGFDVWSNSTLLEATGGAAPVLDGAESALTNNLVSKGAFDEDGGTSPWGTQGGGSLAAVASGKTGFCLQLTNGGPSDWAKSGAITTVVGKLYQFTVYAKAGTEATYEIKCGTANGTGQYHDSTGEAAGDWSTVETVVFEATTTAAHITLRCMGSPSDTMFFDSVTLYEVTPGCVATDTLAFDGWYKDSHNDSEMWRMHSDGNTESVTKLGSFYALKMDFGGAGYELKWSRTNDTPDYYGRFAGRTVTAGCWMKSSSATTLKIDDSAKSATTVAHSGGGGWEWLELTSTFAGTITWVNPFVIRAVGTETIYLSQPMLVFGNSIGSGNYTRPQGEVVDCETLIPIISLNNKTAGNGFSDVARTTANLESDTNGMVPKGAKAVDVVVGVNDSGSASAINLYIAFDNGNSDDTWRTTPAGIYADARMYGSHRIGCDANGDIAYTINASGSNTFDVQTAKVTAITLR